MNKVTDKMKQQIIERYPFDQNKNIAKDLGISVHTVSKWGQKLKLKKDPNRKKHNSLSESDENIIITHYPNMSMDKLSKLLNKSPHAIHELARRRNIKREINENRNGTLKPLFNNTVESMYWLGFIAADGYISKNGHLMISQSSKDLENIVKLSKFLNTSIYKYVEKPRSSNDFRITESIMYRINISDKILGSKINEMFGVLNGNKKTYTQIKTNFIRSQDHAFGFLCGLIDGDGHLNNNKSYVIQCHKSWLYSIRDILKKLPNEFNYKLQLLYRKDKDEFYTNLYIRSISSKILRTFADKHNIGSTRKFQFS